MQDYNIGQHSTLQAVLAYNNPSTEPAASLIHDTAFRSLIPWRECAQSTELLEQIDNCSKLNSSSTGFVSARSETSNAAVEVELEADESHFMKTIKARKLVPELNDENDWSGRGQHVEFERSEAVPLKLGRVLGHSATALVQAVRCRRIKLARKSISLSRTLTLEEALNEVEHLQNLRHSHIVRPVGTYLQGKTFAVLMYPAAEWNLKEFMLDSTLLDIPRNFALTRFFGCLANAVAYIHNRTTRHMDIKPMNILVKRRVEGYRVYLADFDVAINFRSEGHSQTDTPRKRTLLYCAPEVYASKPKGRASDIFSLGCVFAEMLTVLAGFSLDDFAKSRFDGNTSAFHATLPKVHEFMSTVCKQLDECPIVPKYRILFPFECLSDRNTLDIISTMLNESPEDRPLATTVSGWFLNYGCCQEVSEEYTIDDFDDY